MADEFEILKRFDELPADRFDEGNGDRAEHARANPSPLSAYSKNPDIAATCRLSGRGHSRQSADSRLSKTPPG